MNAPTVNVAAGRESSFELKWPSQGIRGPVYAGWKWHDESRLPAARPEAWVVSSPGDRSSTEPLLLEPSEGYYSVEARVRSQQPLKEPLLGLLVLSTGEAVEAPGGSAQSAGQLREVQVPIRLKPVTLSTPTSIPWWIFLVSFVSTFVVWEASLQLTRKNLLQVAGVTAKFTPLRRSGLGYRSQRGKHGVSGDLEDAVRKALHRGARFKARCKLFMQQPFRCLFGEPYSDVLRVSLPIRGGVSVYLVDDARVHRALAGDGDAAESLKGDEALFVMASEGDGSELFWVARNANSFMGWTVLKGSLPRPGTLQRLTNRSFEICRSPEDSFYGDDFFGWRIEPRAGGLRSARSS
ncbi:MAG: hypothetical protein AAGD01_19875 [Acidobacteriota bacterium]